MMLHYHGASGGTAIGGVYQPATVSLPRAALLAAPLPSPCGAAAVTPLTMMPVSPVGYAPVTLSPGASASTLGVAGVAGRHPSLGARSTSASTPLALPPSPFPPPARRVLTPTASAAEGSVPFGRLSPQSPPVAGGDSPLAGGRVVHGAAGASLSLAPRAPPPVRLAEAAARARKEEASKDEWSPRDSVWKRYFSPDAAGRSRESQDRLVYSTAASAFVTPRPSTACNGVFLAGTCYGSSYSQSPLTSARRPASPTLAARAADPATSSATPLGRVPSALPSQGASLVVRSASCGSSHSCGREAPAASAAAALPAAGLSARGSPAALASTVMLHGEHEPGSSAALRSSIEALQRAKTEFHQTRAGFAGAVSAASGSPWPSRQVSAGSAAGSTQPAATVANGGMESTTAAEAAAAVAAISASAAADANDMMADHENEEELPARHGDGRYGSANTDTGAAVVSMAAVAAPSRGGGGGRGAAQTRRDPCYPLLG
eukprot:TRINITY_DN72252_c0_g1_i1.p1 TRINITY_DN72252_c0_g1~~TRINITY_DN72252_c0_g1_i1.p1  ORF type:complete len:490 (+),score=88.47 TRINITY_DN72252_c0_g1_i1:35-1504(+)